MGQDTACSPASQCLQGVPHTKRKRDTERKRVEDLQADSSKVNQPKGRGEEKTEGGKLQHGEMQAERRGGEAIVRGGWERGARMETEKGEGGKKRESRQERYSDGDGEREGEKAWRALHAHVDSFLVATRKLQPLCVASVTRG